MAARKLKFKPKPVVGGAVRRPREKEEIPQLKNPDTIIIQEPPPGNINLQIDVIKDQNSAGVESNVNEEIVSKRMKIEEVKDKMISPPVDIGDKGRLTDLVCSSASVSVQRSADETQTNITSCHTTEQLNPIVSSKLVGPERVSTGSSESSVSTQFDSSYSQESMFDKPNTSSESNTHLNTGSESITSLSSSQESSVNVKLNEKLDVSKGLPRFGRSKFKPVLSNNNLRIKAGLNNDTVANENALALARTESVIKRVKSDINKSSIVAEITESFSALESDETDHPEASPASKSDLPKTTYRFENDNEDARTTNESSTSNRVHLVNQNESNRSVESCRNVDQSDSQSQQMSDSVLSSEISNTAAPLPSPTKVPISPLKLTSKILVPKPCPNLLDTTVRRISFHGSDSEEESKRKISLSNDKLTKKIKKDKDTKNNKRKLSQGSTYSKLGQEALEKFTQKFGKVGKPPDKAKLTMLDLIFYNPKSNPMSASTEQTGIKKKEEKIEVSGLVKETLAEQSVDDVEEVEPQAPAVPVPQLKVGPDGQIMLDPKSLVIETTEVKEKRAEMEKSEVVRETGITRYNTYSKRKHVRKDWSAQETLQFYKALNTIGSDFTLMTKLFPKRSRHELKLKFKKEEKTNMKLVDLAMTAPTDFDFSSLEEEMKRENEEIARLEEEKRLAAEAMKKAKAERKEEKVKNKERKHQYHKLMRVKDAAFKDFDETETEKMKTYCPKPKAKKRRRVAKKKQPPQIIVSSSSEEETINVIDVDSDSEVDLDESELKLLKMIREKTRSGTRRGRKKKQTKKLEEYEKINETLKRTLEEIDSDESDRYTPNGPGADMLFGSPVRDPFPDVAEQGEESQWVDVVGEPCVEDSASAIAVDVGERSESEPLTQDVVVVDLPLPLDSHNEIARNSERAGSVLSRHLISESIKIIDQLTSSENLNEGRESIVVHETSEWGDQTDNPTEQELGENLITLPSLESVNHSRPPVVYSLHEANVPSRSDQNSGAVNDPDNNLISSEEADHRDVESLGDTNQQDTVLSIYSNNSEECILGD